MKIKLSILLAATLMLATAAWAQLDTYAAPRWISILPTLITNGVIASPAAISVTNQPIDIHAYDGVAAAYFTWARNPIAEASAQSGSLTVTVYGSNTATNRGVEKTLVAPIWAISNLSIATSTPLTLTNYSYSLITQRSWVTNTYHVPGTIVTADPATQGFAGQYLVQEPFTNAAVGATTAVIGSQLVGFQIGDQPRYLQLVYTVTGTNSVFFVSGAIVAKQASGRW